MPRSDFLKSISSVEHWNVFSFPSYSSNITVKNEEDDDRFITDENVTNKERHEATTRDDLDDEDYKQSPSHNQKKINTNKRPKVLLFITTHASDLHKWYLKSCWRQVIQSSRLIQNSDVFVYMNRNDTDAIQLLQETFQDTHRIKNETHNAHTSKLNHELTIHVKEQLPSGSPERMLQDGAMDAMKDAIRNGWFDNYDWVIRLNPDVIIRNETFLYDIILDGDNVQDLTRYNIWNKYNLNFKVENITRVKGIFINCRYKGWTEYKIHTDFFAIRPEVLNKTELLNPTTSVSELSFTKAIYDSVLKLNQHLILPNSESLNLACRAGNKLPFDVASVIHHHPPPDIMGSNYTCPFTFS